MRLVHILGILFAQCVLGGNNLKGALQPLRNRCIDTGHIPEWWTYIVCFEKNILQVHFDHQYKKIVNENAIGAFVESESNYNHHIFRSSNADCQNEKSGEYGQRYAEVEFECCANTESVSRTRNINHQLQRQALGGDKAEIDIKLINYIESITEPTPCVYYIKVCSDALCPKNSSVTKNSNSSKASPPRQEQDHSALPSSEQQEDLLQRVRTMFTYAYDTYMDKAFPEAELKPLTCQGGEFSLIKIPLVTLIDALDTLVVMGNHSEFVHAVQVVERHYPSFNLDVNVSLFETTIRVLGGLLSAHLMSVDPTLRIYDSAPFDDSGVQPQYNNILLRLAQDLGDRLLPAFDTKTRIPYGTVNLNYGVPQGETEVASTAGAGSLVLEFEVLSRLTGDRRYGDAAFAAVQALYSRKSPMGLLGKHIHVSTGRWHETMSGIGSNSDSFYEYLFKAHLLFRSNNSYSMFLNTYGSIKKHVQSGSWFGDVDMFNTKLRRNRVENLHAFWPGMESTMGFTASSAQLLNSFYSVWSSLGFLPEEFDQLHWEQGKAPSHAYYPLRPELIESTYLQYRATGDRSWLRAGQTFLDTLETTRTDCGYASVGNMATMELQDSMPSFFLSETCKYLYLLFDEKNFIHDRPYVFSTEAHPFDTQQLHMLEKLLAQTDSNNTRPSIRNPINTVVTEIVGDVDDTGTEHAKAVRAALAHKCPKKVWWDSSSAFKPSNNNEDHADKNNKDKVKTRVKAASLEAQHWAAQAKTVLQAWKENSLSFKSNRHLHYFRRGDVCSKDQEEEEVVMPAIISDSAISDSAAVSPAPLQTVEVSLGDELGSFAVEIFADGFRVDSKQFGNTIIISSVGQPYVFGRELHSTHSRTVVGSVKEYSTWCSVSLTDTSRTELWSRACSVGLFGATHSLDITAEIVISPTDLCKPVTGHEGGNSWWQKLTGASPHPQSHRDHNDDRVRDPDAAVGPLSGKFVLVGRGVCLFETKALHAQQAGAIGLIVSNTEDQLFMMSGKVVVHENQMQALQDQLKVQLQKPLLQQQQLSSDPMTVVATASTSDSADTSSSEANPAAQLAKQMLMALLPGIKIFTDSSSNNKEAKTEEIKLPAVMITRQDGTDLTAILTAYKMLKDVKAVVDKPQDNASNPKDATDDNTAEEEKDNDEFGDTISDSDNDNSTTTTDDKIEEKNIDDNIVDNLKVRLTINHVPVLLDSEQMGQRDYPKIRVQTHMITVQGQGGPWSVVLTSTAGKEWQLFIVSKNKELINMDHFPFTVMSRNGQPVSVSRFISNNPVELYANALARQCPAYLSVQNHIVKIN